MRYLHALLTALRVWHWRHTHPAQYRAAQEAHRDLSDRCDWNRWKDTRL